MAENEKLPSSIWSKLLRAKELVGVVKKTVKSLLKTQTITIKKQKILTLLYVMLLQKLA